MNRPAKQLSHPSLSEIKLLAGSPFYDRQKNMNDFLLAQDDDRMLYNFRKASGLSVRGAEPMTGWDAEECKLKGHTTGHYLSGLALAYSATGDERFLRKLEYMVSGLAECQEAFSSVPGIHKGFLSAYNEEQFDLLEGFTKYPEIWAPYYTLDKIMSGLLDAYELAGIRQAVQILDLLGDWVYARLSCLPDEQREKMWSMYIAGEYGGMIGTMIRLGRITGKESHIKAAHLFENPALFGQMEAGRDELDNMHANQHIPQIIGVLEMYSVCGDNKYLKIARNFTEIVTEHHYYLTGGTGEGEMFHAPDSELSYLTDKTQESCASFNMLRLIGRLHEYLPSPDLMAHYERTLFNHILMSQSHSADGGTTYFLPLTPGSIKHYETEENSCCHGTGMESRYRFMRDIFAYDENVMRIELPVSSSLRGAEDLEVTFGNDGKLRIRALSNMKRALSVRIPEWALDNYPDVKDGYLTMPGLGEGESIELDFPSVTRRIHAASDNNIFVLAKGPYLLAEVSEDKELRKPSDDAGLLPLHRIDQEHYHIYFRK